MIQQEFESELIRRYEWSQIRLHLATERLEETRKNMLLADQEVKALKIVIALMERIEARDALAQKQAISLGAS